MHSDRAGVNIVGFFPHPLEQLVARVDLAGMAGQQVEQVKLFDGQRAFLIIDRYQPLVAVNEYGEEIEPYWAKDPADSPEKVLERTETGEAILRSIQKLPPEYRVPVILVDLQEMDYAEASAVLHLPLGTFKSRLSRARQKLRDDLLSGRNKTIRGKYADGCYSNRKFDTLLLG